MRNISFSSCLCFRYGRRYRRGKFDIARGYHIKTEKLGPLLMCAMLAISGCQKPQPKATIPAEVQAAPSSPWKLERDKDTMTDEVLDYLVASDLATNAVFQIHCKAANDEDEYVFSSSLFIASTGSFKQIEYRFDDEKSFSGTAFIDKRTAILGAPGSEHDRLRKGVDFYMAGLSGVVFGEYLTSQPRKRLRVRLKSFDGGQLDLDFDITGIREKMNELAVACGKPRGYLGY